MDLAILESCFEEVLHLRKSDIQLDKTERRALLQKKYPGAPLLKQYPYTEDWAPVIQKKILECSTHTQDAPFSSQDTITRNDIDKLRRHLYLKNGLRGIDDRESLYILGTLFWNIGLDCFFLKSRDTLLTLFHMGIDLYISGAQIDKGYAYDRELDDILASAKRLGPIIKRPWDVDEGKIDISDSDKRAIHLELEHRIEQLGGQAVLRRLFRFDLSSKYNAKLGRYRIYRTRNTSITDYKGQNIPYRYLMQICVKHLVPNGPCQPRFDLGRYRALLEMARDYLTILDICDPSMYADLYIPIADYPDYLVSNAIYEAMCIPPQYAPEFCELLIKELYFPYMSSKAGKLQSLKRVILPILRWCLRQKPGTVFSTEDIQRGTGLGQKQISSALHYFSIPHDQVNRSFLCEIDPADFDTWPLVSLPNDRFFLLCPEMCGYGFCERVYYTLKERVDYLDRHLGRDTEAFVKRLLDRRGIPYATGEYKDGKQVVGQCDLVLEGERKILFAEIKKCPLPVTFAQGDDIEILHSLGDGMAYAQIQALKNREYLEKHGSMMLYPEENRPGPAAVIDLRGRYIMTAGICLPEYAFFANAQSAHNLLAAMAAGSFSAVDPSRESRLKKFNQKAQEFQRLFKDSGIKSLHDYTHGCCFRSVQQFWYALRISHTADELIDHLTRDCIIFLSPLDFYPLLNWP